MLRIDYLAIALLLCNSAAFAQPFDYKKIQPSRAYFSGKSSAEIDATCQDDRNGVEVASFCAKRDFETMERRLQTQLRSYQRRIAANDKELASAGLPPALPAFLAAQKSWRAYRDDECRSNLLSLGRASGRYYEFWDCMSTLTEARLKALGGNVGE